MSKEWRNRIVGYDNVAPDQLMGHPYNYRRHGAKQQEIMSETLGTLGWVQAVLVSKNTGTVLDGHMRVELALRNDEPTVPVIYVEVSEDEERTILATFDPLGGMAYIDRDQLAELVGDIDLTNGTITKIHESLFASDSETQATRVPATERPPKEEGVEWARLSFRCPMETLVTFYENAESWGMEPHEYLLRAMENDL